MAGGARGAVAGGGVVAWVGWTRGLVRPAASVILKAGGGSAGDRRKRKVDGEVVLVSSVLLQEAAEWPRPAHPGPLTRHLSGHPPGSTRPQGVRGIAGACVLERDSRGEIEYLPIHLQAKDNALREEIT